MNSLRRNTTEFAIIGAGIGGLTLGYYLKAAGRSVVILESDLEVGGAIKTVSGDGFISELGPQAVYAREAFIKLLSRLKLEHELLAPKVKGLRRLFAVERKASSSADSSLALFPFPRGFFAALGSPILTLSAKVRLLLELMTFIDEDGDIDESISSFLERRFGQEVTRKIVGTFLGGIWASDISLQSARSTLPSLWSYKTKGYSLLRGILQEQRRQKKEQLKTVTFKRGMATLPQALQQVLEDNILLGSKVLQIARERDGAVIHFTKTQERQSEYNLRGREKHSALFAKQVILTTPAHIASQLLSELAPSVTKQLTSIFYSPVGILTAAIPALLLDNMQNYSGFLVPPASGRALLGTTFSSHVFEGRSPQDHTLVTCYSGGLTNAELSRVGREDVRNKVLREFMNLVHLQKPPSLICIKHLQHAVPSYPVGHFRLQEALRDFEQAFPQIRILANWDRGIGVAHRVEEAENLSKMLIEEAESQGVVSNRLVA